MPLMHWHGLFTTSATREAPLKPQSHLQKPAAAQDVAGCREPTHTLAHHLCTQLQAHMCLGPGSRVPARWGDQPGQLSQADLGSMQEVSPRERTCAPTKQAQGQGFPAQSQRYMLLRTFSLLHFPLSDSVIWMDSVG